MVRVGGYSASTETYLYQPTPPEANAVRIGWMYPYTYAVSMSALGYLSLFKQLDQRKDVAVRRINTDTMRQEPLGDMELMGFSFAYELDILEILKIVEHYHLPVNACERTDEMPLVFAGGPVIMTNPEPYAEGFDFFLIGEGEGLLDQLIIAFKTLRTVKSRREKLLALARMVPGIYVPSLYEIDYEPRGPIQRIAAAVSGIALPVEKQMASEQDWPIASTPILTGDTVFSDTFLVEVMRGCPHRCRFCLASYSMLPARGPDLSTLQSTIETGLQYTPKIGLLGALIAEHPEFEALCVFLRSKEGIKLSSASLRADTLTPDIAQTFLHGGQQTVTLAIETGSERLRHRINKHLKTEAIYGAANILSQTGIPALKLYSMVGLPTEEIKDIQDTINLVKGLKKQNPRLRISLGCSTFVPKAATPFQWMSRDAVKTLQFRQETLRKALVKTCEFRPTSPRWDYLQAVLSRGDRRLWPFIVAYAQQGANLGAMNRTLKYLSQTDPALDLPDLDWYACRERPEHEILPWDTLFLGVNKSVLYRESGLQKPAFDATLLAESA